MRFQSTPDALRGAWNRGSILEALDREVSRSLREGLFPGVLIADVDYFKAVHDTYGHLTGNSVLRDITKRMQMEIRFYDADGLYGGEEFLILLNDSDTRATIERLRSASNRETVETSAGD